MRIGYLGPKATFSEQAAIIMGGSKERRAYETIEDVLESTYTGETDACVAPIENSTEGTVNATVDSLLFDYPLIIRSQLALPVRQHMMVRSGFTGRIERVLSHPQSLAQCRAYLRLNHHSVEVMPVASNAEAARLVSCSENGLAAIGPELAAEVYGLEIIARDIQDQPDNTTYFVMLSRDGNTAPAAGHKTTLAFSTLNRPGELYRILDIFSLWDINMTKIISRPMKNQKGEYVFLVDIEDYNERDAEDALTMVRRKSKFYRVLGSYPAAWASSVESRS